MLNKDYVGTLDDFLGEYTKIISEEELTESISLLKTSREKREENKANTKDFAKSKSCK